MKLDDNCSAGPKDCPFLKRYYDIYQKRAREMNISLASTADKSKAFGPSKEGEVLGLMYDRVDPRDKDYTDDLAIAQVSMLWVSN